LPTITLQSSHEKPVKLFSDINIHESRINK
jgi:hypothetical protein